MKKAVLQICLFLTGLVFQANAQLSRAEIQTASLRSLRIFLTEFREYLSLPNNGKVPADIQLNLDWTKSALEKRGLKTQILSSNGVPLWKAGYLSVPENLL
jgi:hypothetical protein